MKTLKTIALLSALAVPIPALAHTTPWSSHAPHPGTPDTLQAGDLQHVANLPYTGGSDLEFATKTVPVLDPFGNPVCEWGADGECLVDSEGNVVYQTEERDYAFLGRLSAPVWIVDITDPANPVKVSEVPCRFNQNDVQISGDVLIMAVDGSGTCTLPEGGNLGVTGFATADISDPRFPRVLGKGTVSQGAHTLTAHPTQPIVYVSNGDLIGPAQFHIFDISNPAAPVKVRDWQTGHPQDPPHDITFNATGTRAYCACGSHTEIIDTTDPRNPVRIALIPNPENSYAHQADPTPDGDFLLVTDELGGGIAGPVSPGGGIHVYDIRDEATPIKVGTFFIDPLGPGAAAASHVSTAHVFRINPDGYTMAIGWYNDGVHVVDFSDIRGIAVGGSGTTTGIGTRTIGSMKMPNADTWAAKMWQERHPGYVFANDMGRGFDVFRVTSMGPSFLGVGSITASGPSTYEAGVGVTRMEFEDECELTPRSQGVDGWVMPLPASATDGTQALTVTSTAGVNPDPDIFFYSPSCSLLAAEVTTDEPNETQTIPEGATYALVASWYPGPIRFTSTVGPAEGL